MEFFFWRAIIRPTEVEKPDTLELLNCHGISVPGGGGGEGGGGGGGGGNVSPLG